MLSYLPSPSFNTIGPFRLYGLMIALGVYAAVVLSKKRWVARGGDPGDITAIATWAVPAGLIGARLYHVATDWKTYRGQWLKAFEIWNGGLGIPGGVLAGLLTGIWVVKRRHLPVGELMDVVAPALPLAQAIGRLGNWFNQELYGRPSKLPWALRIDPAHRPMDGQGNYIQKYVTVSTYHPTFLYEALWNLGLLGLLLWVDKKHRLRSGNLFALYVFGYGLGRLWVEDLRIDHASLIFGVRINLWTSGAMVIGGGAVLLFRRGRGDRPGGPSAPTDMVQAS